MRMYFPTFRKVAGIDATSAFVAVALFVAVAAAVAPAAWLHNTPAPPRETIVTFAPKLEFPDCKDGRAAVGEDGLIPVKVVGKLANKGDDKDVFWRITATRIGVVGNHHTGEEVWASDYPHLRFRIARNTDKDRTFTEKIMMPSGNYYVLVSLCSEELMPDLKTGERLPGVPLVSDGFYVTVP